MTKREKFLAAMHNQEVDSIVWAPNLDYWLKVNAAEDTVPDEYKGLSRNDIVRAIGASIWNRASGLRAVYDSGVTDTWTREGTTIIHQFDTPIGSVREVYVESEGASRTPFLSEHLIKDLDSLKILKYVVNSTHYEPDYEPTLQALAETGDDGIVLNACFCVPFIQFAKMDAGYMNGFYLWMDHREIVDSLLESYFESFLEGYRVLADGPADAIATGDNMDGTMISPQVFREYAIPFYQEARKITEDKGKIFEGHWCGRTQNLLPITPSCGLDVVEAIVTNPMADISLNEALDLLRGEVVLQGGIPSVLVCEQGGSRQDFEEYMQRIILPLKGRRGFILGMSDNVPPNADFSRIVSVAGLIS